jgi:hypothetical protein
MFSFLDCISWIDPGIWDQVKTYEHQERLLQEKREALERRAAQRDGRGAAGAESRDFCGAAGAESRDFCGAVGAESRVARRAAGAESRVAQVGAEPSEREAEQEGEELLRHPPDFSE